MTDKKVLVIGLDGYEVTLGEQMMIQNELPSLAKLKEAGAHMRLDHGSSQRSGLAWEHVASGLSPDDANRWAALTFDSVNYKVWQEGTSLTPFTHDLNARTVVFDAPYFDLRRTPNVQGVVNWGAHDPGVATNSSPSELLAEFTDRFGIYPAKEYLYGLPWPSPEACRRTGDALSKAVETRADGCLWLLKERLPDWDLGLVVISEPHSAIEALWHGVDTTHPLHGLPSAAPAKEGLRSVYRSVDRMVGRLLDAFPQVTVVVFSMGGMGPNRSDVVSMVLLSELLYRNAFGAQLLQQRQDWVDAPNGLPMLKPGEDWALAVQDLIPEYGSTPLPLRKQLRKNILSLFPASIKRSMRTFIDTLMNPVEHTNSAEQDNLKPVRSGLHWMPATHYWPYWHAMPAFALPSFYDGRIRINLKGRELKGMVDPAHYRQMCDELEALLHECCDPRTGKGVVDFIERPAGSRDPRTLGPTECDLMVVWNGPLALDHPRHGRIGPVPYRRSGGHTGPYGMAYFVGSDLLTGDYGVRSSFDVVPTIIELLGEQVPVRISGTSLLKKSRSIVS